MRREGREMIHSNLEVEVGTKNNGRDTSSGVPCRSIIFEFSLPCLLVSRRLHAAVQISRQKEKFPGCRNGFGDDNGQKQLLGLGGSCIN